MHSLVEYTIAIPAHNEEDVLESTVKNLADFFSNSEDIEILIVNNSSYDKTPQVAERLQSLYSSVRLVNTGKGLGYGIAIKTAITAAKGKYIVFVMADGSELPQDVSRMIAASRANPSAHIFGNRFTKESNVSGYPKLKRLLNIAANYFLSFMFRTPSRDLTNGFKLFPREPLVPIVPSLADDFSITLQLSMVVVRSRKPIVTIPNSWIGREIGKSKFKVSRLILPYLRALTTRITF